MCNQKVKEKKLTNQTPVLVFGQKERLQSPGRMEKRFAALVYLLLFALPILVDHPQHTH